MAHKKGGGSSTNGRDSNAQRLGVKAFAGELITGGSIIMRQRGTRINPGGNWAIGPAVLCLPRSPAGSSLWTAATGGVLLRLSPSPPSRILRTRRRGHGIPVFFSCTRHSEAHASKARRELILERKGPDLNEIRPFCFPPQKSAVLVTTPTHCS